MTRTTVPISIAELARQAGVTVRTVRYYVAEGLLPPPAGVGPRSAYGREHLLRLEAVRRLKARYYPLSEIRRALADRSAEEVVALLAGLSESAAYPDAVGRPPLPSENGEELVGQVGVGGARPPLPVGRAEVLSSERADLPSEATWRRVCVAPDVELHFRPGSDLARAAAIRRLIAVSIRLLSGEPDTRGRRDENWA